MAHVVLFPVLLLLLLLVSLLLKLLLLLLIVFEFLEKNAFPVVMELWLSLGSCPVWSGREETEKIAVKHIFNIFHAITFGFGRFNFFGQSIQPNIVDR